MNDQHKRAQWHNYRDPGIYMLTIVAERRGTPFAHLVADDNGHPFIRLTSLGQAVEAQLHDLPQHAPGLAVLRAIVMPDHIHVVVHVRQRLRRHLGTLVQGLKYGTTIAYLRELDKQYGGTHRIQNSRPAAGEREKDAQSAMAGGGAQSAMAGGGAQSAMARGGAQSAMADEPPSTEPFTDGGGLADGGLAGGGLAVGGSVGSGSSASSPPLPPPFTFVPPLWASNYHDRILLGRGQLARMLHYVSDNPRRGWIKRQYRDIFYNKRMVDVPLTVEHARWLLVEARHLGVLHELQGLLIVEQRQGADTWRPLRWWEERAEKEAALQCCLRMKAMGNTFLLDESLLLPMRLSRRTPPGVLQAETRRILERCEREGAVVVTPAVSPAEEAVLRAVLDAGYRAIRLQATAMSDVAAPSEPFYAPLSREQLLIIAPWPARPQSAHPHKGLFELQNLLCRLLANEDRPPLR